MRVKPGRNLLEVLSDLGQYTILLAALKVGAARKPCRSLQLGYIS